MTWKPFSDTPDEHVLLRCVAVGAPDTRMWTKHYECAVREIELLVAEWKRVAAAQGEAEARADKLAEALRKLEGREQIESFLEANDE